jgi:hypothetical protein
MRHNVAAATWGGKREGKKGKGEKRKEKKEKKRRGKTERKERGQVRKKGMVCVILGQRNTIK